MRTMCRCTRATRTGRQCSCGRTELTSIALVYARQRSRTAPRRPHLPRSEASRVAAFYVDQTSVQLPVCAGTVEPPDNRGVRVQRGLRKVQVNGLMHLDELRQTVQVRMPGHQSIPALELRTDPDAV